MFHPALARPRTGGGRVSDRHLDGVQRLGRLQRLLPIAADLVKGALASVRWEQLGWPQNRFTGSMQAWGTPTGHSRAMSGQHWAWHGAGVKDGDRLLGPQGWEFDGVDANGRSPRNLTVLSRSRLSFPLAGRGPVDTDMTIMDRPNGTFVFDAGQ